MAKSNPSKKPARSVKQWRAENPVAQVLARRVLAVERQIDQDDRRLHELESRLPSVRLLVEQVHRLSERVQQLEHDASLPNASELHEAFRLQHRATNAQRAQTFAINALLDRLKSAEENLAAHEQTIGALAVAVLVVFKHPALSSAELTAALNQLENYSAKSRSVTGSSKD